MKKKYIYSILAALFLALTAIVFFAPDDFEGNVLQQHDMMQGTANGQEGKAFAEALEAAGNEVTLLETKGTPHGYDGILNSTVAKQCMDVRVRLLRKAFGMGEEKTEEI